MHTKNSAVPWLASGVVSVALFLGASTFAAQLPTFTTPDVTRAEAMMFLLQARIPNVPALVSNGEFPDVAQGAWYERYVVIAERLGIVQANPVTHRIRPDDPVTRAEFLSMASRTFGVDTSGYGETYADIPLNAWFVSVAGMAQTLHLFPADANANVLHPDQFMSHLEVAKAVQILETALRSGGATGSVQPSGSYQTISTQTQNVMLGAPIGPVPAQPHIVAYVPAPAPSSDPAQIDSLRRQVLSLVNAARASAGLPGLQRSDLLEKSAQLYAKQMADQGFFGHVSPTGETLQMRMQNSGYYNPFFQSDCLCIARYVMGENLARGQKTASEVVNDWLQSPSHREAIMNPEFTDTGIGVNAGVWVEHFGGKQK